MDNITFANNYFFPNVMVFFSIYLLVFSFLFIIYRKNLYGYFDPFLLTLVFTAAGNSVVILLYILDLIDKIYLLQTILSQLMFIAGYKMIAVNEYKLINNNRTGSYPTMKAPLGSLFFISAFLFLTAQYATYALSGFPILLDSRLEVYQSGGFGVLGRITDVAYVVSVVSLLNHLVNYKLYRYDKFILLIYSSLLLSSLLLNGSKSGFLFLIFIITIYFHIINVRFGVDFYKLYKGKVSKIFFVSIIAMFVVLMLNYNIFIEPERFFDIFSVLLLRVFNSGDIFVMSYPNDALMNIPVQHNGIVVLFKDLLATFRIITGDEIPNSLGNVVANIYATKEVGGANGRMTAYSFYYFGFLGSLVVTFLLGLFVSLLRHHFIRTMPVNSLFMSISIYFVLHFSNVEIDPVYQFSKLTNAIITFPILFFIYYVIPKKVQR